MSTVQLDIPPAGIHHDVSFGDYAMWPALNFSTLKWAAVSQEHLKASLDGEIEDDETKARKFGRAVHCRLLEPERYTREFLVACPCQGIKKDGDVCGNTASRYDPEQGWFCGVHGKKLSEPDNYISESDAEGIERIAAKVRGHDVVKLFKIAGGFEASIVWEPRPGIQGKARLDKLINNGKVCGVADLKKTQLGKGGWSEFQRAIVNYHYHVQAAWYVDAAKQHLGLTTDPFFWWVSIEEKSPHSVGVFQADAEMIAAGREIYNEWLNKFEASMRDNSWPGYGSDIQMMSLPVWLKR